MLRMFPVIAIACFSWLAAMLVNYLADVLPLRRRLVRPFCLYCQEQQPVVDYFLFPWRCRHCGRQRRLRVWILEVFLTLASVALWLSLPDKIGFYPGWVLLYYLALVAVIDLEHRLIMHPVSLVGLALSLPIGYLAHGWQSTLLGGLVGLTVMLAFYLLGRVFARLLARSREGVDDEALGFGDVILGAITGLLLGWPGILAGLLLSILLAGGIALIYLLVSLVRRSYQPAAVFPFGPTLVAAIIYFLYL